MEINKYSQESTFRDYVRVLFKHKLVILTSFLTVSCATYVGLQMKTPVYQATVKMLISAEKQVVSPYYRDLAGNQGKASLTQSEIVKSKPVIEKVVKALELYNRPIDEEKKYASKFRNFMIDRKMEKLKKGLGALSEQEKKLALFSRAMNQVKSNITVKPIRDTNLFAINVIDFNSSGAAIIANVVSRAYIIFDLEQQLAEVSLKYGRKHPSVNVLNEHILKMQISLSGAPLDDMDAIGPASVKIIEQADISGKLVGSSKGITFVLAVILSVFLGIMLAFLFEFMNHGFNSPQDIEKTLGIPLLGSISKKNIFQKKVIRNVKKNNMYTHSFQNLADQIYLLGKGKGYQTIAFSPTMKGSATTAAFVVNLGHYLGTKLLHNTLIVDANFHVNHMTKIFKTEKKEGLGEVLDGKAMVKDSLFQVFPQCDLIKSGQTEGSPVTILHSKNMKDLLDEAKKEYEMILIDSSNTLRHKDTEVLSDFVDAIVLVVDEKKSRKQVVKKALANLKSVNANVIGVVLTSRSYSIPKFLYDLF